jgi:hypothetical protein
MGALEESFVCANRPATTLAARSAGQTAFMFLVDYVGSEVVPDPLDVAHEGSAEDASGRLHPLYALGAEPLPMPEPDE